MNKIAYTAFTAFWSSMATLLAVYLLASDPVSAEDPGSAEKGGDPSRLITPEELARHDSESSCWKAIDGKVYDVTDYIPEHPTHPSVMLDWCGKDSTEAWHSKGYGRAHSRRAEQMLEDYLIGRLQGDDDR